MARQLGQRNIKYGQPCQCNKCLEQKPKTHEHFYFNKDGPIRKYVCKVCDYEIEKARLYKRRALGTKLETKIKEVRQETLIAKANTRTFPKGHPMNPTKEQRQALIDKIESRRYYKDETMQPM